MALTMTTPAFGTGQEIPSKYTCEGVDDSPEVRWSGAPANTKSFALIVDDPDAPDPRAPKMVWVHWVLYDIPPTTTSLPEKTRKAPAGAHDGLNDWKKTGWNANDVDLYEINEAFSVAAVAVTSELGLDLNRVNVNGGAVALGHPIGASGARILVTLLYEMIKRDAHRGIAALCLGGGNAVAMAVER